MNPEVNDAIGPCRWRFEKHDGKDASIRMQTVNCPQALVLVNMHLSHSFLHSEFIEKIMDFLNELGMEIGKENRSNKDLRDNSAGRRSQWVQQKFQG